jgi:hypothetical protein
MTLPLCWSEGKKDAEKPGEGVLRQKTAGDEIDGTLSRRGAQRSKGCGFAAFVD